MNPSRGEYFRSTAINSNAILHEEENHILRSTASRFRLHGRQDLHDAVYDILYASICHPNLT